MNLYTTKFSTHKISSQSLEVRYVLDILAKPKKHESFNFTEIEDDCGQIKNVTNPTQRKVEKVSAGKSFTNYEIIILLISNFSIT